MDPLALIARLAALIPPPKRHTVRYFGVLSSHASSRSQVVPHTSPPAEVEPDPDKPKRRFRYIRWSELLRRVFGVGQGFPDQENYASNCLGTITRCLTPRLTMFSIHHRRSLRSRPSRGAGSVGIPISSANLSSTTSSRLSSLWWCNHN
jgi:hypothetical protein